MDELDHEPLSPLWIQELTQSTRIEFQEKFYPHLFLDEKRREFLRLVQGDETVAEYGKKFMELARYAITFIMNEEDKCMHFEEGLRTSIRALVTACAGSLDFSKLVEAAIRIEKCLVEEDEEKMVEGEESSPLLDRGQEKEDNKEAEKWTMFCFRQGSHWFGDNRPRKRFHGKQRKGIGMVEFQGRNFEKEGVVVRPIAEKGSPIKEERL
ncbi:Retrotransposon gag protein [Cucumis melo var. makuwa]|uniref:Retrotransposon gag protein n=1 Tax=Cucumis melo var. makuwa TaxID=1194695 RepID=A0A5D3BTI8_CUCMM|nr:Retrotransposon gag protein [Cucumis melo var. makuwa]